MMIASSLILSGELLRSAAVATAAVGGAILLRGMKHALLAHRSGRWPHAKGRVHGIEYRTFRQVKGAPLEPWREFTGKDAAIAGRRAALRFYYRYKVGERDFHGQTLFFGSDEVGLGAGEIREYLSRFAIGKSVNVHHDPRHPENSVLVRGLSGRTLIEPFAGAAIAVAGVAFASAVWDSP